MKKPIRKKKRSLGQRTLTGLLTVCAIGIGVTLAIAVTEDHWRPLTNRIVAAPPVFDIKSEKAPASMATVDVKNPATSAMTVSAESVPVRAPTTGAADLGADASNDASNALTAGSAPATPSEDLSKASPDGSAQTVTAEVKTEDYAPFASAEEKRFFDDLVDLYVYAFPLVLTDQMEREMTRSLFFAPVNQMAYLTALPSPALRVSECPNVDALVSTAWLDLAKGPQVVVFPENPRHDFILELLDAWTNVIGNVSVRNASDYSPANLDGRSVRTLTLVGPSDKTPIPEGMKVVTAPTDRVWLINRVLLGSLGEGVSWGTPSACRTLYEFEVLPLDAFEKESKKEDVKKDETGPVAPKEKSESGAASPKEGAPKSASLPSPIRSVKEKIIADASFVTATLEKPIQNLWTLPLITPSAEKGNDTLETMTFTPETLSENTTSMENATSTKHSTAVTLPAPIEKAKTVTRTAVYEYQRVPGRLQPVLVRRIVCRQDDAAVAPADQPTPEETPKTDVPKTETIAKAATQPKTDAVTKMETPPVSAEKNADAPKQSENQPVAESEWKKLENKAEFDMKGDRRDLDKDAKDLRHERKKEEKRLDQDEKREGKKLHRDFDEGRRDLDRFGDDIEDVMDRMERDAAGFFARGYAHGKRLAGEMAESGRDAFDYMDKRARRDLHRMARDMAPYLGGEEWKLHPVHRVIGMKGEEFFSRFAEIMKTNPPAVADGAMIDKMAPFGIVPGESFAWDRLPAKTRHLIRFAVPYAQLKIHEAALVGKNARCIENHWILPEKIGVYGTDYLERAVVAEKFIGADVPSEILYPFTDRDGAGEPLAGENRYVLHFDKGATPPAELLWSVTLYDAAFRLVPNHLGRYAVRSSDPLAYNEDGSLDILISSEKPSEKIANWLPAPKGEFMLMMRLYAPKKSATDGSWIIPPVTRVASAVENDGGPKETGAADPKAEEASNVKKAENTPDGAAEQ